MGIVRMKRLLPHHKFFKQHRVINEILSLEASIKVVPTFQI